MELFDKTAISFRETPAQSPPHSSRMYEVKDVITGAPGAYAGLEVGDLLLNIEGSMPTDINMEMLLDVIESGDTISYTFYKARTSTYLTIITGGIPLGVKFVPTRSASVFIAEREGYGSHEDIRRLWDAENYDLMKVYNKAAMHEPLWGRLLRKVTGSSQPYPPADLWSGVYEVEAGDKELGYQLIDSFEEGMSDWYMILGGIYYYYQAIRERERHFSGGNSEELIRLAHRYYDGSSRINALAAEIGIQTFEYGPLMSKTIDLPLPLEYLVGGEGQVRVNDLLSAMPSGQLMPLCLLPSYRCNSPYSSRLYAYRQLLRHLNRGALHPMVVVTNLAEPTEGMMHNFVGEQTTLKMRTPLQVLFDPTDTFFDQFHLSTSPTMLMLDNRGLVVSDSNLSNDFEYWKILTEYFA